jgi:adenosylcobinamide kinase/adenosylcobinamide-phosphate guanylyltransferase
MSKVIVVTGGAASGKSRWAVSYFSACNHVLYIASADEVDADTLDRIKFDTDEAGMKWNIVSGVSEDPAERFDGFRYVIFDNLASYTSKAIKSLCPDISAADDEMRKKITEQVVDDITAMYSKTIEMDGNLIIITLETGFSSKPKDPEQRLFREVLGSVNQRIANMANDVYLSVSGIQFRIK